MTTPETVYIYNENCTMKGRLVPVRELDRYDDPAEGADWTGYEATEENARELMASSSAFLCQVGRTIKEHLS